jgi:hypothetical protein
MSRPAGPRIGLQWTPMPELIRPPALEAGDTVAIAALSSPLEAD